MRYVLRFVLSCFLLSSLLPAAVTYLHISKCGTLPPPPGREKQWGRAGPFAGTHNGALIIAGGANFPGTPPWEGGEKVWWDNVFVATKNADGGLTWQVKGEQKLPEKCAYGVSITTEHGIVCIGGCNAGSCTERVFLLNWNRETNTITTEDLPPLPVPLAFMAGAMVKDTIFIAGGSGFPNASEAEKHFLALDFSKYQPGSDAMKKQKEEEPWEWKPLPAWDGPPRVLPAAAAQSDGEDDCFYLFSGRNTAPGAPTELLTDAWKYNPRNEENERWSRLDDIALSGEPSRCIQGAAALGSGALSIFVFGGDRGKLFRTLEELGRAVETLTGEEKEKAVQKKTELLTTHPGFSRDILVFNTVTEKWIKTAEFPFPCPVTTQAVKWDGTIVITSGEVRPGVRTPGIIKIEKEKPAAFSGLNYTVMGIYLVSLIIMGIYFSRREKSTHDFFKGGERVPWWAAGISVFGTQLSAITFMAIPAKTYATDWRYFMLNMCIILVAPFIILFFLPFYRRLHLTTAYEYLEKRFQLSVRLLASLLFMLFQLGRIGIVLFLPSIALSLVLGIDIRICIIVMGVLSIAYTVLGGIEAVIWTDVLQVAVLLGGALISVCLMLTGFENGFSEFWNQATADNKLRIFDFAFDFTEPTFWVVLLGGLSLNIINYGSDQTVIQRYLTTKDENAAARSIWTNAILCFPATVLCFGIGTLLFVFFKTTPEALNPTLATTDAIYPWYIVSRLPDGVSGLLVAAIFAASMSSLDSSMNSVATAATTDWYRRFKPETSETRFLAFARLVTVAVGAAGTALALMMAEWDIKSLWDSFNVVIGLFAGGLGGLFLLGIFSKRANGTGGLVGLIASAAVQFVVRQFTDIHLLLYAFTGLVSCLVVGYAASFLVEKKAPAGMTIYDVKKA